MATPNFDSLTRAVGFIADENNCWMADRWPEFEDGQVEFLKSCPMNQTGWHYYQIPGGPTVHYKTGIDFRNPSMPYHIVKVGGRQVLSLIGYNHYSSGTDPICFEEGPNRKWFSATVRGRTFYMPQDWFPSEDALATYRRFCGGDPHASYHHQPASNPERMVLWAASLCNLHGCENEASFRHGIEHCRQWPSEYSNPEDAVAKYCRHVLPIHLRVKTLGYILA